MNFTVLSAQLICIEKCVPDSASSRNINAVSCEGMHSRMNGDESSSVFCVSLSKISMAGNLKNRWVGVCTPASIDVDVDAAVAVDAVMLFGGTGVRHLISKIPLEII